VPEPGGRDQPNADRSAQSSGSSSLTSLTPRPSSLTPQITPEGTASTGAPGELLIPKDTDERLVYARRLIAQRCLYGVDRNPLAVEMAKLSLWLLTLAKDKPFTFLDHAIRCGDSLVGLSRIDQLLRFSMTENAEVRPLMEQQRQQIEKRLQATMLLRKQIETLPSNTPQDIERKTLMLANVEDQTKRLRYAADLLLAATWKAKTSGGLEAALNGMLAEVEYMFKDLPADQLEAEAQAWLQKAGIAGRFHWPLEFPEVFVDRAGFDAFVCNPPFMGGQKITGNLGTAYRDYLVRHLAGGKRGSADLCAYFTLRGAALLREGGQFGFLATNTIAQGDTREVGLDQLTADGCILPRAVPSRPWPGTASLEVAHVWLRRGNWKGPFVLDEKPVSGITSFLTEPNAVSGPPHRLKANEGKSFQGSIVLGMGFVLTPEEAQALIAKDPRNRDVLFPYLNGEDLNSRPDQSPSRWVINFFDWPLRRAKPGEWRGASEGQRREWRTAGLVEPDYDGPVAADYPDCLAIVEAKVKPERMKNKRKVRRERWWQFAERAPELYRTIAGLERVLVCAQTSRIWEPDFEPIGIVYSHTTVIFPLTTFGEFAVMQASFHEYWRLEYGPSLRTDARYTPSDCFETFPFPDLTPHAPRSPLHDLGEAYHTHRRRIMLARQEGLTKTYNRFHDPDVGRGEGRGASFTATMRRTRRSSGCGTCTSRWTRPWRSPTAGRSAWRAKSAILPTRPSLLTPRPSTSATASTRPGRASGSRSASRPGAKSSPGC